MKKIIIFLAILIATILLTSCSTQQRVVYRECDCPTNRYDYWNRYSWSNPYWGWNQPMWGWNTWGWNNLYWRTPPIIRPNTPSRYERRTNVGPRPSRNNWSNDVDPMYPRKTPSIIELDNRQRRTQSTPSRIQSTPNRYSQPQQRRTSQPSRVQSNPPRSNQNTQPSRVQSSPSRQQTRGGEIIKD
jgi:hypothetical protein